MAHSLEKTDDARQAAGQAIRSVVERVHAVSIQALTDPADWSRVVVDAFDPGNLPGPTFAVEGLDPWENEAAVGSIEVITDETLTDEEIGIRFGMPRDLNGDGQIFDSDISGDARLLPVVARVRWDNGEGEREISQAFYVISI